jgi:hypothetical protein
VRELSAKYPGLAPHEMAEKMRAELGRAPTEAEERLIESAVARVPASASREKPASAWVLIAANVLPLIGVLFWGWDVFPLLALFWMENVVIGVLNAAKMLTADPRDPLMWGGKLFMLPFFCFHYGMFTAVHGAFVLSIFGGKQYAVNGVELWDPAIRAAHDYGLWLPLGVLAASHLFSFFWNYFYRGEFRRAQLATLMMRPYGRVMVLHIAILAGGFAAQTLGSPVWALLLLLALKTGLDFAAHLKEHSKA